MTNSQTLESHAERVSRVRQMADDAGETWDLSFNDRAALDTVLADRAALFGALQNLLRCAYGDSDAAIAARAVIACAEGRPFTPPEPVDRPRVQVASSNIQKIGFTLCDAARQRLGTLDVEFVHGGLYRYYDVPATVHEALVSAPSIGTYFAHAVKPAYRCEKLAPAAESQP